MEDTQQLVTIEQNTPLTDSRIVAQELGVGHSDFFSNMITKYQAEMEKDFGLIRFQNGVKSGPQRGKLPQYALLTEDQTYAYLAYSKNTEQARTCKRKLVKAFSEARKKIQMLEANQHVQVCSTPVLPVQILCAQQALAEWVSAVRERGYTEETDLLFEEWRQECALITEDDQRQWNQTTRYLLAQQHVLLPAPTLQLNQTAE